MDENIVCPFCHETDFDLIGLKDHLVAGRCKTFNTTITIEEERCLSNISKGAFTDAYEFHGHVAR